jgi:hypothetical protein
VIRALRRFALVSGRMVVAASLFPVAWVVDVSMGVRPRATWRDGVRWARRWDAL